jgi:hypothetical protein
LNVKWKVPPTGILPLSKVCPSSLVTVCGTDDTFFQITVEPALMVRVAGLKPKLPLLSFVIISRWVEPGAGVCVAGAKVGVGTGVGVVACATVVGAAAPALEVALPQDASNVALSTTKNVPTTVNIKPR